MVDDPLEVVGEIQRVERDAEPVCHASGVERVGRTQGEQIAADPEDVTAVKAANPFSGITTEMLADKLASQQELEIETAYFAKASSDFEEATADLAASNREVTIMGDKSTPYAVLKKVMATAISEMIR